MNSLVIGIIVVIGFLTAVILLAVYNSPQESIQPIQEPELTTQKPSDEMTLEEMEFLESYRNKISQPIDELVDEYLALIEKLDGIGILANDLVVTPELIDEINDDLDRIKQIVIELQVNGFDGEVNTVRIGKQMVGIVTFFNKETQDTLFEIQIPEGTLSIFAVIGLIDEFSDDGVVMKFEEKTALLKGGLAIVNGITTFEDEDKADEIASDFVLASIGAFHPSVENGVDDSIQSIVPLNESITKSIPSPKIQLASGITPENIICKEGLELIFKLRDNSPACVKPQTAVKLVERGWGLRTPILNELTIDQIIDMIASNAESIDDFIQNLPSEAFDEPALAEDRKNAFHNKLVAESGSVFVLIKNGMSEEAIEKLHDIKIKMDSSIGGQSNDDWIVDPEAQATLISWIDRFIGFL